MTNELTCELMRERLIEAARRDPRIVGLICDGSHSSGRSDEWSDLDVSIFIRDTSFDEFARDWKLWASSFGEMLLGYISWVGHPWAVYESRPLPLRVDFDVHRESAIDGVCSWPVNLTSVEDAVWYDDTGGRLRAASETLVGKSLAPVDQYQVFEQQCGDLWYELLYAYSRLVRGEVWVARQAFHARTLEPLLRLLRFEVGAFERWRASPAATDIERVLTPARLRQLDRCIAGATVTDLKLAMLAAAELGRAICDSIARSRHWEWPERLADRVVMILEDSGRRAGLPTAGGL